MAVKIDCTNYTLVQNTGTLVTAIATDSDTTTLLITPTVSCNKLILILLNTAAGAVTVDIAKGDFWAGKAMTQVSLAQNVPKAFCFESAKSMEWEADVAGTTFAYRIKVTIAAAAVTTSYQVIQLPSVESKVKK